MWDTLPYYMDKQKNRKRQTAVILETEMGLQFLYFHTVNMKAGNVNDLLQLNNLSLKYQLR